MRHLVHMASFSAQTNMHARNLAIVWAPNLLRWAHVWGSWRGDPRWSLGCSRMGCGCVGALERGLTEASEKQEGSGLPM